MATKTKKSAAAKSQALMIAGSVTKLLDAAEKTLGGEAPALTGLEKRRVGKLRKGGDRVVENLSALAKQYEVATPSFDPDVMLARLHDAQALAPVKMRLERVLKRIDDEIFHAQGESWQIAREIYAVLKRRARSDGEVAKNLATVETFFAYRRPTKKPAGAHVRKAVAVGKGTHNRTATVDLASGVAASVAEPASPAPRSATNGASNGALPAHA